MRCGCGLGKGERRASEAVFKEQETMYRNERHEQGPGMG